MNPYAEIRKVPLDYNGIQSSAYSVQYQKEDKWSEVGVVGNNYMLLPNKEVRDAAIEVAGASNVDFTHDKTFFDGRRFVYSLKSNRVIGNVNKGDDLALGMQFWNSYDGSKSFGFSMLLYRLICTNGMMSKTFFSNFRFKHEPNSEGWEENLNNVIESIDNIANSPGTGNMSSFLSSLRALNELNITTSVLGKIRHRYLSDIPVGTWGTILDRFTLPKNADFNPATGVNGNTGWGLLNSATDILWHKEKPTMATYNQNASIVDGLCRAVA